MQSPSSLNRALAYSAASYIKSLQYDKDGEIIETKSMLYLDDAKIWEEEHFDGYYAIVTSELDKTDAEIIETYQGVWKIEETFKISKSDFKTRPIYVSLEAHIEAHFLTHFVTLLMTRVLELHMNQAKLPAVEGYPPKDGKRVFSAFELIESLRNYSCSHIGDNIYNFHYTDTVMRSMERAFGVDLNLKYRKRGEIKNLLPL